MQELETDPIRLHRIIDAYEAYSSGQMDIRECLEKLSKQAISNHRQLLTTLCTPQQETDYPFIRLWCRYYGFNMDELQRRLNEARKEKLPKTAVYSRYGEWQYLNDIAKQPLIELLKLSNL
jgi:hypothetical protein